MRSERTPLTLMDRSLSGAFAGKIINVRIVFKISMRVFNMEEIV